MTADGWRDGGALARCPVFGECGGCQYQDVPYEEELALKGTGLRQLFEEHLSGIIDGPLNIRPVVRSPKEYHYRCRLDMKLLKTKKFGCLMGFTPAGRGRVVEIEACPIAMEAVSDFLPELKRQAVARLPDKYRNANLVVKTGDDGRVFWGGIGRRSLRMREDDFLWTEVCGRKIFYSLDTFFQANLSILPRLAEEIRALIGPENRAEFYDLYGGVGLFGVCVIDLVSRVILIEENIYAIKAARRNFSDVPADRFEIVAGTVEEHLSGQLARESSGPRVAMIDPPRKGLSESVARLLAEEKGLGHLLYLSCNPESLVRDLKIFLVSGWRLEKVTPFDFFPKTRYLEVLVDLKKDG